MSLPASFIPDTNNGGGLPGSFIPNGQLSNPVQSQVPSQPKSQGNFLTNLLPSLGKNLENIGGAAANIVNPNPNQNTLVNLLKLGVGLNPEYGAVNNAINIGVKAANQSPQGKQVVQAMQPAINTLNSPGQAVGALGNYYKQRYGGVNNIANTFNTDPVGMAMDVSPLLDAGASLAGETGTLGKILNTASDVTNPVAMIGKGITGAGQLVSAPFKGSFNPDIANLAADQGVSLPASAMTNNKLVQISEALASKGLFGQRIINRIQGAKDTLNSLAQQTTNAVNASPDFLNAGEAAQNGFNATKTAFQSKMNGLYGDIIPQIANQPADASNTMQVLNQYMENAKNNLGSNPAASYYQGLQARIAPLQELTQKGMVSPDQQLTAAELRATMQDVGNRLKNPNDPVANADQGALKQLYGALGNDLDNTISKYDPAVGQQLKETNAQYAQGKQLFNSQIGRYIQDKDPEQIVNQIFKPNSVTNINRVKQMVGEDGFGQLQNAFMAKLMKNSLDKNGMLDGGKLTTNLSKYDDPTLNAMFSPDQLKQLENTKSQLSKIGTLRGAITKGTKVSEGSQTAFLGQAAGMGALAFTHPVAAGQVALGQYASSLPFSTNMGINYLTKGGKNLAAPVGNSIANNSQLLNLIRMASSKQ